MLVSPLGSAQSPRRNLQLSASLQPGEEGGPFSAGLSRSPGSAGARALPPRRAAGPAPPIVLAGARGPAGANREVKACGGSRPQPGAGRRVGSDSRPGCPGRGETITA